MTKFNFLKLFCILGIASLFCQCSTDIIPKDEIGWTSNNPLSIPFEIRKDIFDRENLVENESFERATSVYLVDRVVPMIPEKLSNNVCSLRPNEEKLCYSIVFEVDKNADILDQWIGRTVINSDRRFDYAEAQAIIEGGEGEFKEELLLLNELAQKIRARRFKNGAISFERVEVKFDIESR